MGMRETVALMQQGHRIFSVGDGAVRTYVLTTPDGESSSPLNRDVFLVLIERNIIEQVPTADSIRTEYTLAWPLGGSPPVVPVEVIPEGHSEWVEIPLSGTLCIEALPAEIPDPASAAKQPSHVYLDK